MGLLNESVIFIYDNSNKHTVRELSVLTGESIKDIYNLVYKHKLIVKNGNKRNENIFEFNLKKIQNSFEVLFCEANFCLKKGMDIKESIKEISEKRT